MAKNPPGGVTQDIDFSKGFTKGILIIFLEHFGAKQLGSIA